MANRRALDRHDVLEGKTTVPERQRVRGDEQRGRQRFQAPETAARFRRHRQANGSRGGR